MNKKAYLQISFGWLFAIIVGIFILFLAILGVSKVIKLGEIEQSAKTGKEIGILTNPLETGFESAKVTSFGFSAETRIYNKCDNSGIFGKQGIQVSQKSFNKWTKTYEGISFENKYIFSERYAEGKVFYLFSKPFEFPFKVADLIYLIPSSEEYCFYNAPEEVEEEISGLKQENLKTEDCSADSIKICFDRTGCDIDVNYNEKSVEKNRKLVYFEGDALMYAAIFSDAGIYECQLRRLMQRTEQLCKLYQDKENFVNCGSNLYVELIALAESAGKLKNSKELYLAGNIAEELQEKNDANQECKLW